MVLFFDQGTQITGGLEGLLKSGLIGSLRKPVKILGQGDIGKALSVEAHAFSKSAREKIEGAGGTASVLGSGKTD